MKFKNNPIQSITELQFLWDAMTDILQYESGYEVLPLHRPFRIFADVTQDDSARNLARWIDWTFYQGNEIIYVDPSISALNPDMAERIGFTQFDSTSVTIQTILNKNIRHTIRPAYTPESWTPRPLRKLQPVLNMWTDVRTAQKRVLLNPRRNIGLVSSSWDKVDYDGTTTRYTSAGQSLASIFFDGSRTGYLYDRAVQWDGEVREMWAENLNLQVNCPMLTSGRALLELRGSYTGAAQRTIAFLYPVDLVPDENGFAWPAGGFSKSTWQNALRLIGWDGEGDATLNFVTAWYDVTVAWPHLIEDEDEDEDEEPSV